MLIMSMQVFAWHSSSYKSKFKTIKIELNFFHIMRLNNWNDYINFNKVTVHTYKYISIENK